MDFYVLGLKIGLNYVTEVVLADICLFIGGFLVGVFWLLWKISLELKDVYIVPETKKTKANMVHVVIEDSNEKFVYVNPQTPAQTRELMWQYTLWKVGAKSAKDVTYVSSKEKRIKRVQLAFFSVFGFFILASLAIIITVQQ